MIVIIHTNTMGLSKASINGSRFETWFAMTTFFLLSAAGTPCTDIGSPVTVNMALNINLKRQQLILSVTQYCNLL